MRTCSRKQCPQQALVVGDEFCYYHRKVNDGLISKLSDYLSDVEVNAMMDGRLHQDGRRLDHYFSDVAAGQP
jgi:hypothetical protein